MKREKLTILSLILLTAIAAPFVVVSSGEPTKLETVSGKAPDESQSALDGCCDLAGDANQDGNFDFSDLVFMIDYLWTEGAPPPCLGNAAHCDDYELTTIRDVLVLVDYIFFAGPLPTCAVPNPPYNGPVDPDNFIEIVEGIFPAGETTMTVHVNVGREVSLTALNVPLKITVDGQVPTIANIQISSGMAGLDVQYKKIDSTNGKVLYSLYKMSGGGLAPGLDELGTFELSMPYDAYDRLLSVAFDTMPPIENGRAVHYPLMLEPDLSGWTPDLQTGDTSCCVVAGDGDGSGSVDVADLGYMVDYLYRGGPPPPCLEAIANMDDVEGTTVRDLIFFYAHLFGFPWPLPLTCDAVPFTGWPVDTNNYIEQVETILPGGNTTVTMHINMGNVVTINAMAVPLRVRVDGQIPVIDNVQAGPLFSGSIFDGGTWVEIDSTNGKIMFSANTMFQPGLSPGSGELVSFDLTMPYDGLDRLVSIALDSFPPVEKGRHVSQPLFVESGPGLPGWAPYLRGSPSPQAIVALSPAGIYYPSSGPPSLQVDTTLSIVNLGNTTLNYSIQDSIISGPPSLWLTYDGFDGSVEPGVGNYETGNLHLNTGGAIDSQMVADSGGIVQLSAMLIITSNAPSSPDTLVINFHVIDESFQHEQEEMGDSTQTVLSVSSDGNYGAMGSGGNMGFPDDPDTNAAVYLFDGSPVIGWIDGRGDTVVGLSSYGSSWQPGVGFRPADTASSYHYSSYLYDVYSTGLFTSWDSSIWVEQLWYSPRSFAPGVDNFYIQKLRLFVADGQAKQNMIVGQAIDWNIPSDYGHDNGSGVDMSKDMIYQFGLADPGKSTGNDSRFGGLAFLGSYINGQIHQSNPFGMYTADNASNIDPVDGYDSKQLYQNMSSTSGASVFDGPDQDLHMAMTGVQGLTLQPADTLETYWVYSTSREGLPELQNQIDNSQIFFDRRVDGRPESAHGIGGTFLADIDGVYGIHARILGDRTGGTVFHYEASDTTGNGDFAEVGPWGTANVYLDGENNTHVVVTDPVALANGAYLFFAYQPGDSLSRTPLLDLYWEDIAGQPLQDIPIPTFSAIDVGSPPGAKASGDTVVVRKQTLWGCTVNFTFYAADTLISFADLTGDIRRHSSRIQLVNPHPTMQLLSWWKPPFQQGYRALYEGLLETQSILRKIVYLRTDLFCGEAISLQEFNVFDPDRACCFGLRGNVNGEIDNMIDVADLTFIVDYLFRSGPPPPCFDEADYNASGGVDVADLGDLVDYLFRGGPPPGFCP